MSFDIFRFNQFALNLLRDGATLGQEKGHDSGNEETIGEYLERERYSDAFRDDYLVPIVASLWNTSPDKYMLQFPVTPLIRFLWNHHILSTVGSQPDWLTIPTGSQSYIDAVMRGFPSNHLFLNTPVKYITNDPNGGVRLHLENGGSDVYDHVILAIHGDQAHELIRYSATSEEAAILSSFKTLESVAVLHSDPSFMPVSKKAWSGWNYLTQSRSTANQGCSDRVSLTYNMNILQHIPPTTFGNVLVTLNPFREPDSTMVQGRFKYAHPLFNTKALAAQNRLYTIQNTRGISYAGGWTKYGFHEDAFTSGLRVAQEHLGARLPFELVDSTFSRGKAPSLGIADRLVQVVLLFIQVFMVEMLGRVYVTIASAPKSGPGRLINGFPKAVRHQKAE